MYILIFGQFLINVYTSNATLLLFSIISILSPIFIKSKENNPQKIKLGPFHRWPNYVPTHPRIRPAGSGRKGTRVLSFFFGSITRVLSKGTGKKQGLGHHKGVPIRFTTPPCPSACCDLLQFRTRKRQWHC